MPRRPKNRDADGYEYAARLDSDRIRPKRKRVHTSVTSKTRIVNVRVPHDVYDLLTKRAEVAGVTKSDLINAALTVLLLPDESPFAKSDSLNSDSPNSKPLDHVKGGAEDA